MAEPWEDELPACWACGGSGWVRCPEPGACGYPHVGDECPCRQCEGAGVLKQEA